jgi:hypothetical protein
MSDSGFALTFDQLPRTLPLFPLSGVLLLPDGRLPLNMFEDRYLTLTRDVMAGHRLIGMVQPIDPAADGEAPAIYRTGCAGRISSFNETNDGRFLITLTGVCRFAIVEELSVTTPYRQALVSFGRYRRDLEAGGEDAANATDRDQVLSRLKAFLDAQEIPVDWEAVGNRADNAIIDSLAMICPFEPSEKQALLEAGDFDERCRVLTALADMALAQHARGGDAPLQ